MSLTRRAVGWNVVGVLACLAVTMFLCAYAVHQFETARRLDVSGVLASATVVAVETNSSSSSYGAPYRWADVTMEFVDAHGNVVRTQYETSQDGGGAHRGQKIQVRYDSQDPTRVKPIALRYISARLDGGVSLALAAMVLGFSGVFYGVRFSRQRRPVIASARVRDQCVLEIRSEGVGTAVAFSPDGTRLATANGDRSRRSLRRGWSVRIWDAATGARLLDVPHVGVDSLVFSPDGSRLVTTGVAAGRRRHLPNVRIWDAATGEHRLDLTHAGARTVAFSADGTRLVTSGIIATTRKGRREPNVRVWDAATGVHLFDVPQAGAQAVALSPDGARLCTVGDITARERQRESNVRVWDAGTGVHLFDVPHEGVRAVAFSPDSARLATAGRGRQKVTIWDAVTGQCMHTITAKGRGQITTLVFSSDGTHLATAGGDWRGVRIWDAVTGECLRTIGAGRPGTSGNLAVLYGPNGAYLATIAGNRAACIWDTATGEPLLKVRHIETLQVKTIAFAPDTTRWVTSDDQRSRGVARIWELPQLPVPQAVSQDGPGDLPGEGPGDHAGRDREGPENASVRGVGDD